MENHSPLSAARLKYQPKLAKSLRDGVLGVATQKGEKTQSIKDQEAIAKLFPKTYGAPIISFASGKSEVPARVLNVGVVLSGGQAPGGHNVIAGIFDGIKSVHKDSKLFGFKNGPSGLENGDYIDITSEYMDQYRNTGGFDIIGSGRTKLEKTEQFDRCIEVAKKHNLSAIVIIGGDDSNTNAAVLAEYFAQKEVACSVVGCPKTIDGDLKNGHIEISFGFDTAAKTYSNLIANISRDANSAKKYWHFIKLMGRSASHIGLEAALQTHPNICLISEEVAARKMTLKQIVNEMSDVVEMRANAGKNFGVALIPEGLVEFIPEMKTLISQLNDNLAHHADEVEKAENKVEVVCKYIEKSEAELLKSLPAAIQNQLLLDRDPHGNVQVSLIETEKLLIELVKKELKSRSTFKGKFSAQNHFFGYEGRCALPSNFDADYSYGLGFSAAVLAQNNLTGYMAAISNLSAGSEGWKAGGVPTSMMMNMERRHGEDKPVIQKALVDLEGGPFKAFAEKRKLWAETESYRHPGSIQYFGPTEICDQISLTLALESK